MMGSCGLGTTSLIDMKDFPPSLHEVFFQESDFFDAERVDGIPCRHDLGINIKFSFVF